MPLSKIRILLFLAVILTMNLNAQNFDNHRYTEPVFEQIEELSNVIYTTVPQINSPYFDESNTVDTDFMMDIFLPANDEIQYRPAVVFCHSGAFLTGNRYHEDMLAFCDSLSRRGFVTATIDYRQGFNALNTNSSIRAVFRGLQEARSAVRFLRAHSEEYGIDVNKVYIAGSSAGGFMALHAIYMNEESEVPASCESYTYQSGFPPQTYNAPDLGGLDMGQYLEEDGEPNAAINMWGAIQSPVLIKETDDSPVILIHGTSDPTVPFEVGSPFGFPLFPPSYGSSPISDRLTELGFEHETYFVEGEGHEFYGTDNGEFPVTGPNTYWDTVYQKVNQFLWELDKPMANFDHDSDALEVSFNNLSEEAIAYSWDFGDGNFSNEVNPIHTYAELGQYTVTLEILNDIQSWDTVMKTINVGYDHIDSKHRMEVEISPNPSRGIIHTNGDPVQKIELYDMKGTLQFEKDLRKGHSEPIILPSHIKSGIYICRLWLTENEMKGVRLIVL
ncbi:MAG: carboxylesterase family protein [Bacteroidales bacterium]|nr:carboxylesterase family protein [Bacteroidales bacterium]